MISQNFEVKLADCLEEKEEIFRLRYEIFSKELRNERGARKEGSESDAYDGICDHLIVLDKEKNKAVGTYRLLAAKKSIPGLGFYSERIFEIGPIKELGPDILELGRACIHRDYRQGVVINMLWKGIAEYIKKNAIQYLFGCGTLYSDDKKELSQFFSMIRKKYYAQEGLRVNPRKGCALEGIDETADNQDPDKVFLRLPPLIKGYLRLGMKICSPPAWDHHLKTPVFFLLFDVNKANPVYKKHYMRQ